MENSAAFSMYALVHHYRYYSTCCIQLPIFAPVIASSTSDGSTITENCHVPASACISGANRATKPAGRRQSQAFQPMTELRLSESGVGPLGSNTFPLGLIVG